MAGVLYLIPTPLADDTPLEHSQPQYVGEVLKTLDFYVVEELRTARRFISRCKTSKVIDDLTFSVLNEHTSSQEIETMLLPAKQGHNMGLMSEAGLPGVADPGAELVAAAHRLGIEVCPLVGPSSLMMALMASGMNGQSFAFNGYLPIKDDQKAQRLTELERRSTQASQSQIFIETPYRNNQLLSFMLQHLRPQTKLCVATELTSPSQYILTLTIEEWRKTPLPNLNKRPTVFIIGN